MQKPFIPAAVSLEALEALASKAHIQDEARLMLATGGARFVDFVIKSHFRAINDVMICPCPEHIARYQAAQDVLTIVSELALEMGVI